MTAMRLVIAHLYPDEMNIYGDLGNVLALSRRVQWRGHEVSVQPVQIGEPFDFSRADLVFGGGGQDRGQLLIERDLVARGAELREHAAAGLPMLVVCGLYQLFGRGFHTVAGAQIQGVGIFDATTVAGSQRMIGNIVVHSRFGRLVGFENHSGQTVLEPGQEPLGRVEQGFGNDPSRRFEGAITNNVIGTYLHGPVLPKNPVLADHLILQAMQRRYGVTELDPLDDALELAAARSAAQRPRRSR